MVFLSLPKELKTNIKSVIIAPFHIRPNSEFINPITSYWTLFLGSVIGAVVFSNSKDVINFILCKDDVSTTHVTGPWIKRLNPCDYLIKHHVMKMDSGM
jgi:hypothetical protein